jgi:hypothetical protein
VRRARFLPTRDRQLGRRSASVHATASILEEAEELSRAGRPVDAIDRLVAASREHRDPTIEIRLLRFREEAARAVEPEAGRSPWPPVYEDPFPDVVGRVPEIELAELRADVMGGAVAHHGALIVRNLLEPGHAQHVIEGIHRAKQQRDRNDDPPAGDDERTSWYVQYPLGPGINMRPRVEQFGGIWLADSPANTAFVLDVYAKRGVIPVVAEHFGERPCFSLQKSALRQLAPVFGPTGWHQDGAFLGADVRSMNVWTALSACGGDRPTPGLEIVPKRMAGLLPSDSGIVRNSVASTLIDQTIAETPSVRPEFEPGDGILFDERLLHRTYLPEHMTRDRYALECWLFAPSHPSPEYLPFLV